MFANRAAVGAALLVVIAGHLRGALVWGAEFVTVINQEGGAVKNKHDEVEWNRRGF